MNNSLNDIGTFIAKRRKELNLTQDRLANMIGVTNKMVSNWENGRTAPDILLLDSLAKALETDVSNLLLCNKEVTIRKKKNIIPLIIIIGLLFVISLGIFFNKNDKQIVNEYVINSSNQDNILNGKAVIRNDKTTIYIDEMAIYNNLIGTDLEPVISSLDFYIYQDEVLFSSNYHYDNKHLSEVFDSIVIIADIDKEIDIYKDTYIRINYGSEVIIPIKFSKMEN